MMRRSVLAAAASLAGVKNLAKAEANGRKASRTRKPAPKGFLWGTAISAHQSEGNNVNSDSWVNEHVKPTLFHEPSGDACDSYERYGEDIAIAAGIGLNCHRFGIEWARIEPVEGEFSIAVLDHYARVLETCRARGLAPMVTFNHFTVPRWFAERGGFEVADGADLFARFASRATARLGPLMAAATTFNEANVARMIPVLLPAAAKVRPYIEKMLEASAKASGSDRFSSIPFAQPDVIEPVMLDAHAKAYAAIKAGPGRFPVGLTLSMHDIQAIPGGEAMAEQVRRSLYAKWLAPGTPSDFIGVQTYTRILVGSNGPVPAPPGAELTGVGYENYPQALGAMIRYAAKQSGKPVYVTESGIATDDDAKRIAFIDASLDQVRACLDEGVDVRSYIHWSLLDNYEWTAGFKPHFGLVAVDRTTFKRTPKASAYHLGQIARYNRI